MLNFWQKIPEQIRRLSILVSILGILFFLIQSQLIPDDFGVYGHYRASAVDEILQQDIRFAGHEICADCHEDIFDSKRIGFHRNLSCEVCHGPAVMHTEEPDEHIPPAPRERGYCPLCHEYSPSRPTGFPQIISAEHNTDKSCISCHDPHTPEPPDTPKECAACHAEIANTKSLSYHKSVPCTYCHTTPDGHKERPHEVLPGKPKTRDLCGECHSPDADSHEEIPRVDLDTHEIRYVCWQCHYPHLPEAK